MKKKATPLEINKTASSSTFVAVDCIESTRHVSNASPIDLYWDNVRDLNKLIGETSKNQTIGKLLLLGYVSAVESYFRKIFCKIICLHPASRLKNIDNPLTYGAAISLKDTPEQLAESLLEESVFSSGRNIKKCSTKYLGVEHGDFTSELGVLLEKYDIVCQMRHCAVHRFGYFGVKNAIRIGFDEHFSRIGNRLKLDENNVDLICGVCTDLVKVYNNFLFNLLLKQTLKLSNPVWK